MFKVKNKNTKTTSERSLTLNIFYTFYKVSIADFEQINVSWVMTDFNQRATNFLWAHLSPELTIGTIEQSPCNLV